VPKAENKAGEEFEKKGTIHRKKNIGKREKTFSDGWGPRQLSQTEERAGGLIKGQ